MIKITDFKFKDLINRLQGIYKVPIEDGGKNYFKRKFDVPLINQEAALVLGALCKAILLDNTGDDTKEFCRIILGECEDEKE